jgi:hypothetical protein
MRGHGAKFTRKMEEAVAAMLTQCNVEEAARSVGVSIATLMRWQKEPEFQKAYREARREAFGQSIAGNQRAGLIPEIAGAWAAVVRKGSGRVIGIELRG